LAGSRHIICQSREALSLPVRRKDRIARPFTIVASAQPPEIDAIVGYDSRAKHDVCFDIPAQRIVIPK